MSLLTSAITFATVVISGLVPNATMAEEATCGVTAPCDVESGEYYVALPDSPADDEQIGAIIYLHGWKGKADRAIENKALRNLANELGVALIVPQGIGGSWSYPGSPSQDRDEFKFFDEMLTDVSDRFPIDREKILLSGFSMGGSMVWNLACYKGENYAGFAPIAGAFWDPIPAACPSPLTNLYHTHGVEDKTVPMVGRAIGANWRQSDVFDSLDVWKRQAGLYDTEPTSISAGELQCDVWSAKGEKLELCLHDGGHSMKANWIRRAWLDLANTKHW
ncbi:Phospholipase/Carboxylesterase [Pseudovibrio sp. W64]|uniref:alpha/beta hydrolase family esterase n=1 Tax=unclassified Pseudovibrio TaxID=2627060 RepID=UPI0007B1D153|nr:MULTISPECIES: alpha/beta hydrolase-fold protein [unclassified Pseudovibrio]KZK77910.1 Phospholipase/Carboxylesterase [Pseudovibrio sp. W64]KZK88788.1 Phospholipase/Carboxylesterase [Pseudovibrio sp. Ad5]